MVEKDYQVEGVDTQPTTKEAGLDASKLDITTTTKVVDLLPDLNDPEKVENPQLLEIISQVDKYTKEIGELNKQTNTARKELEELNKQIKGMNKKEKAQAEPGYKAKKEKLHSLLTQGNNKAKSLRDYISSQLKPQINGLESQKGPINRAATAKKINNARELNQSIDELIALYGRLKKQANLFIGLMDNKAKQVSLQFMQNGNDIYNQHTRDEVKKIEEDATKGNPIDPKNNVYLMNLMGANPITKEDAGKCSITDQSIKENENIKKQVVENLPNSVTGTKYENTAFISESVGEIVIPEIIPQSEKFSGVVVWKEGVYEMPMFTGKTLDMIFQQLENMAAQLNKLPLDKKYLTLYLPPAPKP